MARENELTDLWAVAEIMEVADAFRGVSFSITGHLGRPRKDIVRIIEQAGGRFDKAPSYGTTFLITNRDWNKGSTVREGASKKLIKARSNGVKIISEEEFCNMLIEAGDRADSDESA